MELENVLFYFSLEPIKNLPFLAYVNEEQAKKIHCRPFYLYQRPFTVNFLTKLSKNYNMAIYSSLDRDMMEFLLEFLDDLQGLFEIWVSNFTLNSTKNVEKFFSGTWDHSNVVLLDFKSISAANNPKNWIPVIKFRGNPKDSCLLYLEKYLHELAKVPDVSVQILNDFRSRICCI